MVAVAACYVYRKQVRSHQTLKVNSSAEILKLPYFLNTESMLFNNCVKLINFKMNWI